MPPSQPAVTSEPNVAAAVASQNAALEQKVSLAVGAATPSGLVGFASAPTPAPVTKQDRVSAILKGIAAIAAEVGPEFIHSGHGTVFLGAGELALQLLGAVL